MVSRQLFLKLFLVMAIVPASGQVRSATVEFDVRSLLDEPIGGAEVVLTPHDQSQLVFHGSGVFDGVPYGAYQLSVWKPGFGRYESLLVIQSPGVYVRPYLNAGSLFLDGNPRGISGTVSPVSGNMWVNLIPLAGGTGKYTLNGAVRDGRFSVTGLDDGLYVLIVMQGTTPLALKRVFAGESVEITLQNPSADGIGDGEEGEGDGLN